MLRLLIMIQKKQWHKVYIYMLNRRNVMYSVVVAKGRRHCCGGLGRGRQSRNRRRRYRCRRCTRSRRRFYNQRGIPVMVCPRGRSGGCRTCCYCRRGDAGHNGGVVLSIRTIVVQRGGHRLPHDLAAIDRVEDPLH